MHELQLVRMVDLIPAVIERIYRDLASPKPQQPQPVRVDTTAKKVELTRADVDQIILSTIQSKQG